MSELESSPDTLACLLDLAREAVAAAVEDRPAPVPDALSHLAMGRQADAFVTLTEDGLLRGCMGTLGADEPVGAAVVRAATLAATRDPRFAPVAPDELERLNVEVSVLGPSRPLPDPNAFVAGRDGIVVEAHGRRAILLPQVATEMGWGAEEMLYAVCQKAGLRAGAWREPGTHLSTFCVQRTSGPAADPEQAAAARMHAGG